MSHSSGSGGATPKPNYNKHFPRSFMLNYGEALSNLPDEKILCRLFDWNCEWLSRPNIAISEMASTLKENWSNIMAYRGTVFTPEFVDDLRNFVDPILDPLRRVDNKDKLDTDPPDANDVLKILKAINFDPWVEDLFTDAFNAVGPVLMMSIHILVINCLMHNPDVFAEKSVRAPTTEKFKTDPSFKNMMKYLIDQILMRRRTVKRSTNDWDCAAYLEEEEEDDTDQRRPSRSRRSLSHPHPKSGQSPNSATSKSRRRVPQPSTSTDRADRGATSRTRRASFDVSGIAPLPNSDDQDEQPRARHRKQRRFVPSPVDEAYCSEENLTLMTTAKKNKRPLNGPSTAKNRRRVLNVDDDTEDEAEIFITQTTTPKKKKNNKRRRSPSPTPPPAPTTEHNDEVPQSEDAEAKSKKKHKKKKKNKDKTQDALARLIADQDKVQRELAKGNRK